MFIFHVTLLSLTLSAIQNTLAHSIVYVHSGRLLPMQSISVQYDMIQFKSFCRTKRQTLNVVSQVACTKNVALPVHISSRSRSLCVSAPFILFYLRIESFFTARFRGRELRQICFGVVAD
jgi:hypothetical protein